MSETKTFYTPLLYEAIEHVPLFMRKWFIEKAKEVRGKGYYIEKTDSYFKAYTENEFGETVVLMQANHLAYIEETIWKKETSILKEMVLEGKIEWFTGHIEPEDGGRFEYFIHPHPGYDSEVKERIKNSGYSVYEGLRALRMHGTMFDPSTPMMVKFMKFSAEM